MNSKTTDKKQKPRIENSTRGFILTSEKQNFHLIACLQPNAIYLRRKGSSTTLRLTTVVLN